MELKISNILENEDEFLRRLLINQSNENWGVFCETVNNAFVDEKYITVINLLMSNIVELSVELNILDYTEEEANKLDIDFNGLLEKDKKMLISRICQQFYYPMQTIDGEKILEDAFVINFNEAEITFAARIYLIGNNFSEGREPVSYEDYGYTPFDNEWISSIQEFFNIINVSDDIKEMSVRKKEDWNEISDRLYYLCIDAVNSVTSADREDDESFAFQDGGWVLNLFNVVRNMMEFHFNFPIPEGTIEDAAYKVSDSILIVDEDSIHDFYVNNVKKYGFGTEEIEPTSDEEFIASVKSVLILAEENKELLSFVESGQILGEDEMDACKSALTDVVEKALASHYVWPNLLKDVDDALDRYYSGWRIYISEYFIQHYIELSDLSEAVKTKKKKDNGDTYVKSKITLDTIFDNLPELYDRIFESLPFLKPKGVELSKIVKIKKLKDFVTFLFEKETVYILLTDKNGRYYFVSEKPKENNVFNFVNNGKQSKELVKEKTIEMCNEENEEKFNNFISSWDIPEKFSKSEYNYAFNEKETNISEKIMKRK